MCPTDVVISPGNGHRQHHGQCENGSGDVVLETNGGKDPHHCSTSGVSAEASTAPSGGEHGEILSKMRDACERQGCSTKDVSDATLLRFLNARSMNVDKAAKMFVEYENWRASYVPLGYVPDSECTRELAAKKLFLQGRSKQGWAIAVVHGRKHDALHRDLDELKRLIIQFLDKTIARCDKHVFLLNDYVIVVGEFSTKEKEFGHKMPGAAPEAEKILAIVDLKEIGYRNVDTRAFIAGFGFLQAYYPERLAKLLMINAPSFFMRVWKVVLKFLDDETRSKIAFIGPDQVTEACLTDIDIDVLPAIYGGKADLIVLQDAVVPNWPPGKTI